MTRRAGIYGRISLDKSGDERGVERQVEDGHSLADRLEYQVVGEYVDNDVSAFDKKKKRPEFERMLRDLKAGTIDTVIVWRSDRLARQPRDLERVIDVLESTGGQLVSVTEPEFSGGTGLLILRMLVAFAHHESQVKSERVARAWKQVAEQGTFKSSGWRVFGYTEQGEPHPVEAPLYREAVDRLLAGERCSAIVADWQSRGIPTSSGKRWSVSNFSRMMRRPRHAGIVVYQGLRLDVEATWEPLVPRDRWDALQSVLEGRRGDPQPKSVTRHPLTGLARCAACGSPMSGTKKRTWIEYRCNAAIYAGCNTTIRASALEPIVLERFVHVVTSNAWKALVQTAESQDTKTLALLGQLRDDEAALEQLTKDHYVERAIDRPSFMATKAALDARIKRARRQVARAHSPILSVPTDADALRAAWETKPAEWRRSVLEAAIERIEVAPGHRYADRVRIVWKV